MEDFKPQEVGVWEWEEGPVGLRWGWEENSSKVHRTWTYFVYGGDWGREGAVEGEINRIPWLPPTGFSLMYVEWWV